MLTSGETSLHLLSLGFKSFRDPDSKAGVISKNKFWSSDYVATNVQQVRLRKCRRNSVPRCYAPFASAYEATFL